MRQMITQEQDDNRRAPPAAAVPEGALPKPWQERRNEDRAKLRKAGISDKGLSVFRYMEAEIADWRARAAVEADRARLAAAYEAATSLAAETIDARNAEIAELRAALADRAQQGEPVARHELIDLWNAAVDVAVSKLGAARTIEDHLAEFVVLVGNRAATKASAGADAPTDLPKRLRIKAGVMASGEKIAWGSDTELMLEAADYIERAAPVPDAGIPTAGEVQQAFEAWAASHGGLPLDPAGDAMRTDDGIPLPTYKFGRTEIAWRAWANSSGRAPVSTTPTSGEVEKAESPMDRLRRNDPKFAAHLDRCSEMVATWPEWKRVLWAKPKSAAPSHPSEAKAGEGA